MKVKQYLFFNKFLHMSKIRSNVFKYVRSCKCIANLLIKPMIQMHSSVLMVNMETEII